MSASVPITEGAARISLECTKSDPPAAVVAVGSCVEHTGGASFARTAADGATASCVKLVMHVRKVLFTST